MRRPGHRAASTLLLSFAIATGVATPVLAHGSSAGADAREAQPAPAAKRALDRSGKRRVGTASVYSHRFVGRKMADGTRMQAPPPLNSQP